MYINYTYKMEFLHGFLENYDDLPDLRGSVSDVHTQMVKNGTLGSIA